MENIKSILSALTLFWLWISIVILAMYLILFLPWFLAVPFGTAATCGITYAFILIFEKVK